MKQTAASITGLAVANNGQSDVLVFTVDPDSDSLIDPIDHCEKFIADIQRLTGCKCLVVKADGVATLDKETTFVSVHNSGRAEVRDGTGNEVKFAVWADLRTELVGYFPNDGEQVRCFNVQVKKVPGLTIRRLG